MHILIIEDDPEIARLTELYLKSENYETTHISDGNDAVEAVAQLRPDLVLLDLMLPNVDGYEICQQVRKFYCGPILVLTAKEDEMSEVSLLKFGADDYLRKPAKPHIMSARIEALLRRMKAVHQTEDKHIAAKIEINVNMNLAMLNSEPLDLTSSEFELLALLYEYRGQPVSREDCIKGLRGIDYDITDRSIDMRISGLRKKISDESHPYRIIKTIRNKGYLLVDD